MNPERGTQLERSLTNHHPSDEGLEDIRRIRAAAKGLGKEIVTLCPEGREGALALTHLEEAVMWAVKGVALQSGEPVQ